MGPFEAYLKTHGVIPTAIVGSRMLILMENPVIRGTRSLPRWDVPIKLPCNASHCGVGNVGSHWTEPRYKGTTHKDCQQIRSMPYEDLPTDPDMVYMFDNHSGVFGEGTRLAMPKTILRAGLIVIEAWFRGD